MNLLAVEYAFGSHRIWSQTKALYILYYGLMNIFLFCCFFVKDGAQVVEWSWVHATYAADAGSNPGQRNFAARHSPSLSPISCLSTVK